MARYKGPKTKISRRYGVFIGGSPRAFENKAYPPGQHGIKGMRKKLSDYGRSLAEKQKLRFIYGLLEKQFRRVFEKALKTRGVTGLILLQLLETRLDNVLYRFGFAKTRPAARQLVSHGHVMLNNHRCNIASAHVVVGDIIAIQSKDSSRRLVQTGLVQTQIVEPPDWLKVDKEQLSGKVLRIPTREEINPIVNEQLIVELYSR